MAQSFPPSFPPSFPADRVALVSGASRGIGAAVARRLAASGWRLSLGMRRPEDAAIPDGAMAHRFDAAVAGSEADWVAATVARFGRIDALVCNAGLALPRDVVEATDADLDAMFQVNVRSPLRLARAAWPLLRQCGQGRLVTIASLSGLRVGSTGLSLYAVTKHAVVGLTHGWRHAGWGDGIRATAICPGFVATDMTAWVTDTAPADMIQPDDVAGLVEVALNLSNTASVPEIAVNCRVEGRY